MASEPMYRRGFAAALIAFAVGAALFVHDLVYGTFAYVGHSIYAMRWQFSARDAIHLDAAARTEASVARLLPAAWHRFLAFIERARPHRESFGDGFTPEYAS